MREILFKGKTEDGEWVEGSLFVYNKDNYLIITKEDADWSYVSSGVYDGSITEVQKDTICQYTGLTDKNGTKIWENDILEWEFESAPSDYYECFWLEDECAFAFRHYKYTNHYENPVDCYDEDYTDGFYMKVIGNIFDNPEFLKGE